MVGSQRSGFNLASLRKAQVQGLEASIDVVYFVDDGVLVIVRRSFFRASVYSMG